MRIRIISGTPPRQTKLTLGDAPDLLPTNQWAIEGRQTLQVAPGFRRAKSRIEVVTADARKVLVDTTRHTAWWGVGADRVRTLTTKLTGQASIEVLEHLSSAFGGIPGLHGLVTEGTSLSCEVDADSLDPLLAALTRAGVESLNAHGAHHVWTRKQGGVIARAMLALGEAKVRNFIKTIGLFRTKAKNVIAAARIDMPK